VSEIVSSQDFYGEANALVFEAMKSASIRSQAHRRARILAEALKAHSAQVGDNYVGELGVAIWERGFGHAITRADRAHGVGGTGRRLG